MQGCLQGMNGYPSGNWSLLVATLMRHGATASISMVLEKAAEGEASPGASFGPSPHRSIGTWNGNARKPKWTDCTRWRRWIRVAYMRTTGGGGNLVANPAAMLDRVEGGSAEGEGEGKVLL